MISTTPKLTTAGTSLLVRALAGEAITFTTFKIGNGNSPPRLEALTDLVNPLLSFGISGIDRSQPGQVILRGMYDNSKVTSDFRVKEFGIFAQGETVTEFTSTGSKTFTVGKKPIAVHSVTVDGTPVTVSSYDPSTGVITLATAPVTGSMIRIRHPDGNDLLYAYTNDGDNAGMIRAYASDVVSEETVIVYLEIASSANVTAYLTPDAAYVLKTDFEGHVNAKNPHKLEAADLGLDKVENVKVKDAVPGYTVPATLTELKPTDTISGLFGKLAKAVSDLAKHLKDSNNPHKVTLNQLGGARKEHNHSAADINSGVLGVLRGGTGVNNIADLRKLIGGQIEIGSYTGNNQTGSGAMDREINLGYAPDALIFACSSAQSGTLYANQCYFLTKEIQVFEPGYNGSAVDAHTWLPDDSLLMLTPTGFKVDKTLNWQGFTYVYATIRTTN